MLLLPFSLNGNRYALDATKVVEILPQVFLRKIPYVPDYVKGVFVCRGNIVPVIDMCRVIYNNPCSPFISTRIVLAIKSKRIIGMLCEEVLETIRVVENSLCPPPLETDKAPYLGKLVNFEDELIQLVELDDLFDKEVETAIFGKIAC